MIKILMLINIFILIFDIEIKIYMAQTIRKLISI